MAMPTPVMWHDVSESALLTSIPCRHRAKMQFHRADFNQSTSSVWGELQCIKWRHLAGEEDWQNAGEQRRNCFLKQNVRASAELGYPQNAITTAFSVTGHAYLEGAKKSRGLFPGPFSHICKRFVIEYVTCYLKKKEMLQQKAADHRMKLKSSPNLQTKFH